jgi:molecular chaperone DnaK
LLEVERNSPAVREAELVEAVGIETLGGVFTPVLEVGCSVPCEQSRVFSTAADGQATISIVLFRGTSDLAKDNHFLGHFVLVGFPAAPRGSPQIEVTFRVEHQRIILSARGLAGIPVRLVRQRE